MCTVTPPIHKENISYKGKHIALCEWIYGIIPTAVDKTMSQNENEVSCSECLKIIRNDPEINEIIEEDRKLVEEMEKEND